MVSDTRTLQSFAGEPDESAAGILTSEHHLPSSSIEPSAPAQQVLAWHEERDESFVGTLDEVAARLHSTPQGVREAITSGDSLSGSFVDWALPRPDTHANHKL